MGSSKAPATRKQNSDNYCDICNITCTTRDSRNFHFGEPYHTNRSKELANYVFGFEPDKRIDCFDDMLSDPNRKGCFIGLHYLKIVYTKKKKPSFSCTLCGVECSLIFQHLVSVKHKRKYIVKHFSFLFRDLASLSLNDIENIAEVIEAVEGLQKFKIVMKNTSELTACSDCPSKETLDKIVAQFVVHGIDFKNPYGKGTNMPCLETGLKSSGTNEKKPAINPPSEPPATSESTSRQVTKKTTEKQQIHQIDLKNTSQKENALETVSRSSGTHEKKSTINPSVPSVPSAATKYTSRQINDKIIEKPGLHRIDFKDTYRKENNLKTVSQASRINGKRPSQLTPLTAFKRCKSELQGQNASEPVVSLARPVPGAPVSNEMHKHNSSPASMLPTKSYIPPLMNFERYKSELPGQYAGEPVVSFSRPVPVTFSVKHTSVGVSVGNEMHKRDASPASMLPTKSYIPPLMNFERCKSDLPGHYAGEPVISLSRPVPVTFSVSHASVDVPVGTEMHMHNSSQASMLPTTRYIPPLMNFQRCKSELPGQYADEPIESLPRPVPVTFSFSHLSVDVPVGNKMYMQNSSQASMLPTTNYIPPLMNFQRCKSELPDQYADEPIISLSRPDPVTFSFSHASVGVPVGNATHKHNSSQAAMLPTTSYIPSLLDIKVPKPTSSLCRLNQTPWPPVEEHFPSWPPEEPFYRNAECSFDYNSDQSLYGFTNKSAYGQASLVSDIGQVCALAGQAWGQETGPPSAKHLHTLGMMGDSVSPPSHLSGKCSTEASPKQDTISCYGYSSVGSKELSSKYPSPSRIISVFNKEPSLPKSLGDIHPHEDLPPTTSTSLCAKTSQSTNSSMSIQTASVLTPDTLKILQGRDPTSVKSILKRLAEYCPELQQVNICLLVDVLFEAGALS